MRSYSQTGRLSAGLVVALLAGCTPSQHAKQADQTAYAVIRQTQEFALGSPRPFDVTYQRWGRGAGGADTPIRIGKKTIPLGGKKVQKLTLDECLQVGFRNSRSFQEQKEVLYTSALALANTRRGWDFPVGVGALTGEASRAVVNRGGEVNAGESVNTASLTQRLVDGGAMTLGVGVNLASDLLGWRSSTVGSLLSANVTQPLLRGAWRGLAYEEQYRAERNFAFAVLTYERFTQEFGVDILTRYYGVLRQRDELENERTNIIRLKGTLALTKTLVAGGMGSPIEQDEAEQNLLDAQVRLEQSQQRYRDSLDQFKITLGLPMAAQMDVAYPEALTELNRVGPRPMAVDPNGAVAVALRTRPDVLRQAAGIRDAGRDLEIAADAFLPQLDVALGISAPSTGPRKFTRSQFHRHTRSAEVVFDYPLDQTDNRDAYRGAMIAREKARRDYEQFIDQLRLEIRQSYRALSQSRQSYEIRRRSVEIAKRRRKLAVLQQKEGEASTDDVLRAEEALRNAQNGVTEALISYTTTRLQFMTTLGLVWVDEKGRLHERTEPFRFDRIEKRYPYVFRH